MAELIALADLDVFVLKINCEMDKNEIFAIVCLFTSATRLAGLSPVFLWGLSQPTKGLTSQTRILCVAPSPPVV